MSAPRLSDSPQRYVALGTIASSTPRVELLAALARLRPQNHARLREIRRSVEEPWYRVEIDERDLDEYSTLIDVWTAIKGALTSAYPGDKPGCVRVLE